MTEKYSDGVTPEPQDSERQLLVKILTALNNSSGGGGTQLADSIAVPGPPIGTPAANGLLNIIVDSNARVWVYSGGVWQ